VEDRTGPLRRRNRPGSERLPPAVRNRPGISKWNKIEHRLFSQISLAWKDRPLVSHEVVVSTIAAVTTRTGLTVTAELDTREYPKGIKITAKQIQDLEKTGILHRHDFHGEWNYTVKPGTELRVLFLDAHSAGDLMRGWRFAAVAATR
jgi:hypothetical protein